MSFYERFETLCTEAGIKPQSKEMQEITGVSSPAISNWDLKGSLPKGETLCRIAKHFKVTTDYLLGLSEVRQSSLPILSDQERLLLETFRAAGAEGQFSIIQTAMNVREIEKGENAG